MTTTALEGAPARPRADTPATSAATTSSPTFIRWLRDIDRSCIPTVGGKGANLGELVKAGLPVPDAFVVTTAAWDAFLDANALRPRIVAELAVLDVDEPAGLREGASRLQDAIRSAELPVEVRDAIARAYRAIAATPDGASGYVAVRSSATAEDAASSSFAGMFESFLDVRGEEALARAVRDCWASTFGSRILFYRVKRGLSPEMSIGVVVQLMVPSEKSGVMFTIDPITRDANRIVIEAAWGLGEVVVAGQVTPDRYVVARESLAIAERTIARKAFLLARNPDAAGVVRIDLTNDPRAMAPVLTDDEVRRVADLGRRTEAHYGAPQDMEFAIANGRVLLTQSRPITTLGDWKKPGAAPSTARVLVRGLGASPGTASGTVRILTAVAEQARLQRGDILVAAMTSPDWVPAMRRAAAIVTDAGGMTSHASIVSRELGIPCVVGTGTATTQLHDGDVITVDGRAGTVTEGRVDAVEGSRAGQATDSGAATTRPLPIPTASRVVTGTRLYVNLAEPERATEVAQLDVDGVGLLRAEFMLLSALGGTHPRVLLREGRGREFVARMAEGLRTIAAAFDPRPVVYRTTDFRSNEFRNLTGGAEFEPVEENPMIGFRGCFRYTREPELFGLELEALAEVRREHQNLHLMIPFVRTASELRQCMSLVQSSPLGADARLQRWIMAEVPSVVYWLDTYATMGITGVSIGSNDLTQLVLGVDRDSAVVAPLFDERDPAVLDAIHAIIARCRRLGLTSSICGQAPSVHADYAEQLVRWGIDSISVNPDVVDRTRHNIATAEKRIMLRRES